MRIVRTLRVALTGLAVFGAVTAYAQVNERSRHEGYAAAVVDERGNIRFPADDRTAGAGPGSTRTPPEDGLHRRLPVLSSSRTAVRLDIKLPLSNREAMSANCADVCSAPAVGIYI